MSGHLLNRKPGQGREHAAVGQAAQHSSDPLGEDGSVCTGRCLGGGGVVTVEFWVDE